MVVLPKTAQAVIPFLCTMTRRARKTISIAIPLQYNVKTGLYEHTENGITYKLTFQQYNDMKEFYRGSNGFDPNITTWYNSLDRFAKKEVILVGQPTPPDDFMPDPEYPE